MKIKLFIVSYRNNKDLHTNLKSLFASDFLGHQIEVSIINNHSEFSLDPAFQALVSVHHNTLRLDRSTGWLAENWNQAIINGFRDLNNPDCDILIHCQDDTIFEPDWLSLLLQMHESYEFVQSGVGDNFCSYQVEAVKKVGLWDQRYPGIGWQEGDYFLRCAIYNPDKSSISDFRHGRLLNEVNFSIAKRTQEEEIFSEEHERSKVFHPIAEKVFRAKWGRDPREWGSLFANLPRHSLIPSYVLYPYFELACYGLKEKGYLIE